MYISSFNIVVRNVDSMPKKNFLFYIEWLMINAWSGVIYIPKGRRLPTGITIHCLAHRRIVKQHLRQGLNSIFRIIRICFSTKMSNILNCDISGIPLWLIWWLSVPIAIITAAIIKRKLNGTALSLKFKLYRYNLYISMYAQRYRML